MEWLWTAGAWLRSWADNPGFLLRTVEFFMLTVAVVYVYWSMYSIHRMRRSLHDIRNWLQKVYVEQLRAERSTRNANDDATPPERPGPRR